MTFHVSMRLCPTQKWTSPAVKSRNVSTSSHARMMIPDDHMQTQEQQPLIWEEGRALSTTCLELEPM